MVRRFFVLGPICLLVLVTLAWVGQGVSNQELLANFAKAQDFLAGAESVGGLPWWSPMFMQGTSLASSWSFMVTNVVMWIFSIPLGFLVGPKVAVVFMMGLGALGTGLFLRRLTGDGVCGVIGAGLFLLCPSLLTRAAGYEHFVVVCSMALLPWTFLGMRIFFREPGVRTAFLPAVAFAAVFLAYGKTGVMALPVVIWYAASEYFSRPAERRPGRLELAWAIGVFTLLAVVPNLPALRETGFMALFEFGPFEGWQRAFSTKSALGWVDRAGWLTSGTDSVYAPTTANGGTYLGLGVFAVLAIALFRGMFHSSAMGRAGRLFLAFGLLMFWLSFGPKGVVGGQFLFLSLSLGAPDFAPALAWFFVAVQVWVIFRLVPPEWPLRGAIATGISVVYLLLPGFLVLQVLPIYKNIRAPFDFFQVTGAVCVVVAAAIAARLVFGQLRAGLVRSALVAMVVCLMVLDAAPYGKAFFRSPMAGDVFQDFLDVQSHLKASSLAGRVYAFSGRYFYLLTPYLSGRGLVAEAFNNYLQQRGMAILQGSAFLSDEALATFFSIGGVSHVLIDKTDPDTPEDLQQRMRKLLPVDFENEHFLLLKNEKSLGQGFLARDFLRSSESRPEDGTAVFGGARYNLATIEMVGAAASEPGLRGRITGGMIEAAKPGEPMTEGQAFQAVPVAAGGTYQKVAFGPSGKPGWLVMTQAWHPDWKAFQDGRPLRVYRAFLGLPAVKTNGGAGVEFRFEPPWWYGICAWVAMVSWGIAIVALVAGVFVRRQNERGSEP